MYNSLVTIQVVFKVVLVLLFSVVCVSLLPSSGEPWSLRWCWAVGGAPHHLPAALYCLRHLRLKAERSEGVGSTGHWPVSVHWTSVCCKYAMRLGDLTTHRLNPSALP